MPEGSSMVFTCSAIGLSPTVKAELRWADRNGRDIIETTGPMYIEKIGEQSLKLYIQVIEQQHAGIYTCSGLLNGNRVELKTELQLYQEIKFENPQPLQYPKIHTNALIFCRASGFPIPTITWRYNGERLVTGGRYEYVADGLQIAGITDEDNGRYLCRAEEEVSGRYEEMFIDVDVQYPPIITEQMRDMSGVEDHNVTLKCHATGKPLPKYEFYKDGGDWQLFTENHRVVDNNNGMIHFVPLNAEDEGDYKCIARNDVGTAQTEGFLEVIIKPRVYELRDTQGLEGGTGSIICKSSGSPSPSMTWRKSPANDYDYDDGPNENGRIVVNSINPGELQLTISDLTPDDTSNYTCSATNAGGNYKQNGTLAVQFSPRFADDHLTEVFIWEGKTRNITCSALGEPEPYIRWYRKNEWIQNNNETYRIYNIGRNGYLQVTARSDNKQFIYDFYDCRAYNDYGEGEIAIRLLEASLPGEPSNVEVYDTSPTVVYLSIEPPLDDGGEPVYEYRVEYEDRIHDFRLGEDVRLENLRPSTQYTFRVRSKTQVGMSTQYLCNHETEAIRRPYPLVIISDPLSRYSYSYDIRWDTPRTGGLPIKEYWFNYRRCTVFEGTWEFERALEDFTTLVVPESNPEIPVMFFTLIGLQPSSYYQLEALAFNDIGESDPTVFIFQTREGTGYGGSPSSKEVNLFMMALMVFMLYLS